MAGHCVQNKLAQCKTGDIWMMAFLVSWGGGVQELPVDTIIQTVVLLEQNGIVKLIFNIIEGVELCDVRCRVSDAKGCLPRGCKYCYCA